MPRAAGPYRLRAWEEIQTAQLRHQQSSAVAALMMNRRRMVEMRRLHRHSGPVSGLPEFAIVAMLRLLLRPHALENPGRPYHSGTPSRLAAVGRHAHRAG